MFLGADLLIYNRVDAEVRPAEVEASSQGSAELSQRRANVAANMFGGGAVGERSAERSSLDALQSAMMETPWTTSNKQMDDFLRRTIEDEALLMRFGRLPMPERLEIATQLIKRQHGLTNITA